MARQIRQIMTRWPTIVRPETDLISVAQIMREENIGCVLVGDDRELRGLVTDRDLVVRGVAWGMNPYEARVGGICSDLTVTLGPGDQLDDAVRLLREFAVRRAPVVEDDGQPIGIISIGDLERKKNPDSMLADISAARPNR